MTYSEAWLNYQIVDHLRFPFDTLYADMENKTVLLAAEELQMAAKRLAKVKLNHISDPKMAALDRKSTRLNSSHMA